MSLIEDAAGSDGGSAGHITRVNLESPVTNGGANWSAGQRQLIATAVSLTSSERNVCANENPQRAYVNLASLSQSENS